MTREEIMIAVLEQRANYCRRNIIDNYDNMSKSAIAYFEGKRDGYYQALDLLRSSDECNAVELEENK